MDFPKYFGPAATTGIVVSSVLFIGISLVFIRICRIAVRARRKKRAIAQAKKDAHELSKLVRLAVISKKIEDRQKIPLYVGQIYALADKYGFALRDINESRERLERWRSDAERPFSGRTGVLTGMRRRVDPTQPNAPVNVLNPNEPGTPDIGVNRMLALPVPPGYDDAFRGPWQVANPNEAIVLPAPAPTAPAEKHPIELMIEEALHDASPEGALLPKPPQFAEVILAAEDGIEIVVELEPLPAQEAVPIRRAAAIGGQDAGNVETCTLSDEDLERIA